jgi:hypothetical protein
MGINKWAYIGISGVIFGISGVALFFYLSTYEVISF